MAVQLHSLCPLFFPSSFFLSFLLLESVFCENSWWWSAKNKTEQQCLRDPFHLFTIHTQHRTWLHSKTCNMEMRTLKKQEVTFEQVASTAGKMVDRRNERQVHVSDAWKKHAKQCICFVYQHFHWWAFVSNEKTEEKKQFSIYSSGTFTWLKCMTLCLYAILLHFFPFQVFVCVNFPSFYYLSLSPAYQW